MTDSTQDVSSSPGRILRAAREELGFSVGYVADALHLRSSVVESIEQEDYEGFTSDVFLKGYFRSYCRLVNLHEERMVELLDQQLGFRQKQKKALDKEAIEAKKARRNSRMMVSLALGLFIVAIGYLLFTTFSGQQENTIVESKKVDQVESVEQERSGQVAEIPNDAAPEETPEDVAPEIERQDPESSVAEEADVTYAQPAAEIEASSSGNGQVGATIKTESPSEDSIVPVELTMTSEVSIVGEGSFSAEFTGDCWFTLKNGEGKTVFAALKREGDRVNYNGALPFNIVFGNANVVSARFNNEPVNLLPLTRRNGRAEVNLGESE